MITTHPPSRTGYSLRHFVRHYAEMVTVMLLGMFALGMPADRLVRIFGTDTSSHHPTVMFAVMAATMTLPMVAWMRYRGHSWRVNLEMASSMLIPTIAAICLVQTGAVMSIGTLMVAEHIAMLAGMLIAMLLRLDEYAGAGHSHSIARQPITA